MDVPGGSGVSRLKNIHFAVRRATAERPDGRADNIATATTATAWSTNASANQSITCELEHPCLLGFLTIANASTSNMSVAISLRDLPSQWITVQQACRVPHSKAIVIRTGYMPARYVRIDCQRGFPIAINYVQAMGVPIATANFEFGARLRQMLIERPVLSFYNPVVPQASDADLIEGLIRKKYERKPNHHRRVGAEHTARLHYQ
ncbi:unnamed protein product (mitochondrion) [Plasmodiophora brassicae]|uniref:Uncharacterized protein n=1 Tax=Plasmodiophora brassicae TaxID=37360 RepID=A0A0G4IJN2_PLABS|nr:hypothetical protein PBRA_004172 [Plasmodiophora brassicae]SPR00320.1 unnamed protein product [Plasmodiophora brassicae]